MGLVALAAIVAAGPWVAPDYMVSPLLISVGLNVIVCMALCLVMGYAGQISLGHGAFFGIGAYASALLVLKWDWSPLLAVVGAVGIVSVIATVVAVPTLRLRGQYLAVATLGIALVTETLLVAWDALTGGPDGLNDIAPLWAVDGGYPSDVHYYAVVWVVVFVVAIVFGNIVRSPSGMVLRAIRDDELAARCLGTRVNWLKIRVFVLSAAATGVAGALYAHVFGAITPGEFDVMLSVRLVTMAAVGGLGSLGGAVVGAVLMTLLPEGLRLVGEMAGRYDTSDIELLCYGVILAGVMIVAPRGLAGLAATVWARRRRS